MAFSLNQFASRLNKENILHGNRYLVNFGNIGATVGASIPQLNNLNLKEMLLFRAENVLFPGMQFASADGLPPRFGYGSVEGIPYTAIYNDAQMVFSLDGHAYLHQFFYEWTNLIVNYKSKGQQMRGGGNNKAGQNQDPYEVSYKDEYATDIDIYVYEPYHDLENGFSKEYVMHAKLYRAFPRGLPELNLSWSEKNNYLKLPIQFNFTDFTIEYNKQKDIK